MERVTFIRIPKNASTSLYSFFGDANTVRNELLSADNDMHLNIFESSHQSIKQLEQNLGPDILTKPVLAIVRNPFERLVSMYFFAKKYDLGRIYDISLGSFNSFASGFYSHSNDPNFFHAMPQSEFIDHDYCDQFTIVRFEDLQDGIARFIEENGLSDVFDVSQLEKLNATKHQHYSAYYDDYTKSIVEKMWGCDLEKFCYSFDDQNIGDLWV